MKAETKCLLIFGWLSCWIIPLMAQQPATPPAVDRLINCGDATVIVLGESTSKNGHYTLGWTLRPMGQQPAVNWSGYTSENWEGFQEKYPFNMEDPRTEEYSQVFGILDLAARKFVSLPSKCRGKIGGASVAWSDNTRGTQYSFVTRGGRYTWELWLVRANGQKIRAANLVFEADNAVKTYVRKHNPDIYKRFYARNRPNAPGYLAHLVCYFPQTGNFAGNPELLLGNACDAVTLPFTVGSTRSEHFGVGSVTFSLPNGDVVRVRGK